MFDKLVPLSHCLVDPKPANNAIAIHAGQIYSGAQFTASVNCWVNKLQAEPAQRYALYTEDAYPFAVLLFALLHAGKEIWIPGNNRPGTTQQLTQDCQLLGDWNAAQLDDYCLEATDKSSLNLTPLNPFTHQLVIFTSGSTGQAKPITKCLNQFQLEVAMLEEYWGKRLDDAQALATVSHQHIYGLLFRVLWPLSAGRCFHSEVFINPETLTHAARSAPAYWIASPAHLKRLDQNSPWNEIAGLKAIFSSGGALPQHSSQQIVNAGGQSVIEIYGSSETGGIAWRQQEQAWTLFTGMTLSAVDNGWQLNSPYLADNTRLQLDDQIALLEDGRFMLHGRSDRIVKIEEKRLSLAELEQRLTASPWNDESHALVISKSRDVVAVALVLNASGLHYLASQGRNQTIRQLRKDLESWFESVVLPRKWLFVNTLPLTSQGKIDQLLLTRLLDFDSRKLPQVLSFEIAADNVQLNLKVPEDLVYFPDHFASYPILPGVVQLAWVEHFGKLFFTLDHPFSHMEFVKFIQVIRPGDELKLSLNWQAEAKKLIFNFSSEQHAHSSGRMVYGGCQ
ncbi:MAG: AMP-binding protein [Methylococcaceae bacterium]|nr:AMP-binding protein [Methylococcaceae bacterium]